MTNNTVWEAHPRAWMVCRSYSSSTVRESSLCSWAASPRSSPLLEGWRRSSGISHLPRLVTFGFSQAPDPVEIRGNGYTKTYHIIKIKEMLTNWILYQLKTASNNSFSKQKHSKLCYLKIQKGSHPEFWANSHLRCSLHMRLFFSLFHWTNNLQRTF